MGSMTYLYGDVDGSHTAGDAGEVIVSDEGYGDTMTDVQGQYVISEGLIPGTYNVTAIAEGYLIAQTEGIKVASEKETSGVNFHLKLSGGISGKVTEAVSGRTLIIHRSPCLNLELPRQIRGPTGVLTFIHLSPEMIS
jgi:hypothetical protein